MFLINSRLGHFIGKVSFLQFHEAHAEKQTLEDLQLSLPALSLQPFLYHHYNNNPTTPFNSRAPKRLIRSLRGPQKPHFPVRLLRAKRLKGPLGAPGNPWGPMGASKAPRGPQNIGRGLGHHLKSFRELLGLVRLVRPRGQKSFNRVNNFKGNNGRKRREKSVSLSVRLYVCTLRGSKDVP